MVLGKDALLNPTQRRAVERFNGPLLVVAGAGSGKTRILTYRIAHLIETYQVEPEHILAVTFTNKAAGEMKERILQLFCERAARNRTGSAYLDLSEAEQREIGSRVRAELIQPLWVGTFHALCARMLRYDIDKYTGEGGQSWQRNFTIFDESDVQEIVKEIVTKELNLDDRMYQPRSVRFAISAAKNRGLTAEEYAAEEGSRRARTIAGVYERYQQQLARNNALDFDDLIRVPVQLFRQRPEVLDYWHRRFHHILVDEYQDTNRTQYELIRLLATNNRPRSEWDWRDRSVFVVGDADQAIYSFRQADFRILMDFQSDFGDGQSDDKTETLIKLEENYRSSATILDIANDLIANNVERIDKVLRPTRPAGKPVTLHEAEDEVAEAEYIVSQMRALKNSESRSWRDFAVLYRVNAQSQPIEQALARWGVPYAVVGGLRFYDRREIKDVLSYLKAIHNPADSLALKRAMSIPRRGIGKTTLDKLEAGAGMLQTSLWELLADQSSIQNLAGRTSGPILQFVRFIGRMQELAATGSVSQLLDTVLEESGYVRMLQEEGSEEAENRLENVLELRSVAQRFEEENDDPAAATLEAFLANVSLASDLDSLDESADHISLMTLHAAKGLEFPVVFLCGLEDGLFPHFRAIQDGDSAAIEEERRLCYVGITRAKEHLFLSYAQARRLYGDRQSAIASQFLKELPADKLAGSKLRKGFTPGGRTRAQAQLSATRPAAAPAPTRRKQPAQSWAVGDRVEHEQFGPGQVTHVLGEGARQYLAISFPGQGKKIIDPRLAVLRKVE
ncbi:UvrD-helicase domain-containing protein [Gloeobacter kilaueensis]|uniref:DNA 3'-5' helicase n=1 Tax=Gloeobacter kilaueensis (strain ATCC BAA-2537 / CCAP 1431/1 / ULC 316 / JS1) TaxID=1183438 RepID=U5QKI6_GLOK1|nr:UvrD-helicase domain-containing protein [Gloeobacter kilaueensis]AGY59368.1 ATP-dependent DNA helicase PcrA [Gloeobacter kilaueensis JS1]